MSKNSTHNDEQINGNQEQKLEDRTLECMDCGDAFIFNKGEQRFYADRSLRDPKRCKPCRAAKRADRASNKGN